MMIDVLIVEDDPMVAKFNSIYLESIPGFRITGMARNVEESRTLLQSSPVDLILLDVYMKEATGIDLLKELRKSGNSVDVILITAANDKNSVQQALRLGAVDYLIKPFTFERFQNALLQYKKQFQLMSGGEEINQAEIDELFQVDNKIDSASFVLPKGLAKTTLSRISKQIITWQGVSFSAAELAVSIGVSSVSTRKYLNYLAEQKLIETDIAYQETGRPLTNYLLTPDNIPLLQSLLIT